MNEEPDYIDPRTERETRKRHLLIAAVCAGVVVLALGAVLFREMRRSRREKAAAPTAAARVDEGKMSTELRKLHDALKAMTGSLFYLGPQPERAAAFKLFGNLTLLGILGILGDVGRLAAAVGIDTKDAFSLFE